MLIYKEHLTHRIHPFTSTKSLHGSPVYCAYHVFFFFISRTRGLRCASAVPLKAPDSHGGAVDSDTEHDTEI